MGVESITVVALSMLRGSALDFVLLDVREEFERGIGAIGNAGKAIDLHIPMGEVSARFDEIAALARPIVVYCHHGVRSMVVARWLTARGIANVSNLDGGIEAWSLEVDPQVPRY